MDTKQIYDKEPEKWVVYMKAKDSKNNWFGIKNPKFNEMDDYDYKLIAKHHEHIADSIIANPDVEVECQRDDISKTVWHSVNPFFDVYNTSWNYRLAPTKQDFNGGYCIASKEAYDLLVEAEIEIETEWLDTFSDVEWYFFIKSNYAVYVEKGSKNFNEWSQTYKQFYINNGALSWDKPKGEEDGPCNTKISKQNAKERKDAQKETISITDDSGKVYEFEKPEWWNETCKLLYVDERHRVYFTKDNKVYYWLADCCYVVTADYWDMGDMVYSINLTPIKQNIEVEKVVFYECYGESVVESREFVTIEQDYWDKLANKEK